MKSVLNFGILGCGMIADVHAGAINSIEGANLYGAADNNLQCAQNYAQKYGIKAYDSYEDMLADENIDVVCICTPSGFHAQNAIAALNAGKHVVLEKPMAITYSDTEKLNEICKKTDKKLTVISQMRFAKDVNKLKDLVAEGAFGTLAFCNLYMKYWRSEEYFSSSAWKGTLAFDGGGALMNQGIHGVDLLLYIAGNAKVLGAKKQTVYHKVEVEDSVAALLQFDNGAIGTLEASTCTYPGFERRLEILGSSGCAVLCEDKLEKLVLDGKTVIENGVAEVAATSSNPAAVQYENHALQIGNLIKAIKGEEELLIDGIEGQRAVKLIEDIYSF